MDLEHHPYLVPNIFLFVDRRCYPDWTIQKARISFHDLTFVIEGKANYYIDGKKFTAEAGDLVYVPSGSVREAHTFKDSPMHSYPFNFYWADPHNHIHMPFQGLTKKVITKEILSYLREFNHVWMSKQPYYHIQARALFELIIHRLLTSFHRNLPTSFDPRIKKLIEYLTEHYSDHIAINEIAEGLRLHPVYFGKLFKQNTGMSFKEYVNRIRINNAEMMLSSGDFTVKEAAERCGIQDIYYFSKVFKEIKGYPPSAAKIK
ncbi:helix-turn-helix transcriptional regulator [Paenibacillus glycanilyticus]|uniref:AraC family transcriptional regulator n=1 Tax=Paenibacillus glycanilyticus TaxID=126569 RepID=A0ABQ6NK70_9BACL|nr:AraC family transcriptional regulator [Paenibacillus glycanilyticus]GMK45486.1 AraC family transcriptional regulator [Paenibacillus glycanilyticus]